MSDCKKYEDLINSLVDEEISQEDQALLKEHISTCPKCRELYNAYTSLFDLDEPLPQVPQELLSGVMEGIAKVKAPKRPKKHIRFLAAVAVAAVFLAMAYPRLAETLPFLGGSSSADGFSPTPAEVYKEQKPEIRGYAPLGNKAVFYIYGTLPECVTSDVSHYIGSSGGIFLTEDEANALIALGYQYEGSGSGG